MHAAGDVSTNGIGAARSPMLLIHGFTGTPVMWEPLLPLLEPHHECVAITLPGHYGGAPFDTNGDANIVDAYIDAIEQEMDALGWERAHIVGNSLGGWIALGIAGRGRALSTVALAPAGGWEMGSAETVRVQKLFKATQLQLAYFKPFALELAARPRGRMLALREAVAYPRRLPGPLAVQWIEAASQTPCWRDLLAQAPLHNVENTVDAFDDPVRIAWGTKDRILPYSRYTPAIRRHIPQAEWITLDGLGHVPMSDDPELVAHTILEVSAAHAGTAV